MLNIYKKTSKIRTKLIILSMTSSFIGLFLLTSIVVTSGINMIKDKRDLRISSEMGMLASNLVASVMFEDAEATQEMLSAIKIDKGIVYATANSNNSNFKVSLTNKNTHTHAKNKHISLTSNDIQIFSQNILQVDDVIGTITLYVSNREIEQQVKKLILSSFLILLSTMLLVFIICYRMQRTITRPIEYLSKVSNEISKTKDYAIRVKVDVDDEIGLLASEFNTMLKQIEQRDLMLESKVQHRTAELERLAEEFRHRAFHDSLTGLPNRALLYETFPNAIAHAKRSNTKLGLILLDLDNFKTINDTLGHDFGDELLKTFAKILEATLREKDIICRLGGDEFIILSEDINSDEDLQCIGRKLFQAFIDEVRVKNKKISIGMSIGGALYPDHGKDITHLKRAADIAMYCSKDAGKNQFNVFDESMEEATIQRLIVQNDLKSAVEQEQLALYFQPKIESQTGAALGCEVLIRWNHPQYGLLFPDTFIPYAEEAGQMELIDYYVLEKSFEQAARWQRKNQPISVAINLSGAHFHDHRIAKKLAELLGKYCVDPKFIEIELTEAVLISDPHIALDVVKVIKSLGMSVALDDFGVGYSSLSYLRTFPVDTIKLDKSFVFSILNNQQDKRLTKGIISLAKGLELKVVAEGVETQEHAIFLRDIGCHYLQGYYYSKPIPLNQFENWLSNHTEHKYIKLV